MLSVSLPSLIMCPSFGHASQPLAHQQIQKQKNVILRFSKFLVDEVIILGNIDAIDEIIKTIIVIKKTSYASIFTGYALIIEFGKLIFTKPVSCCR